MAEPFNQVSNGWPESNQWIVTEMTALQRQELDAFITTQLETKNTFYLSELTGHSRRNENFTINQHYLDRSVKSLIVCMKGIVFHHKL